MQVSNPLSSALRGPAVPQPPGGASLKQGVTNHLLAAFHSLRIWPVARRIIPSSLIVLAYHRIADPDRPGFYGLRDNVSATPQGFSEQLDYLNREYNVVGLNDLVELIQNGRPLPKNAVLITFDDGYRDNFTAALPELVSRGLPAVLFAVPGFIDGICYPFWDWVIEAFKASQVEAVTLPLLQQNLARGSAERERQGIQWINCGKRISNIGLRHALADLSRVLEVPLPSAPPPGLMMSWKELESMIEGGVAIGAHSATHPILLRVGSGRAQREINVSRAILEIHAKHPVTAFAYPNGDFSQEHERMLEESGFQLGFRVEGGLTTANEILSQPFAIRRTCISLNDDLPRFAAKVAGIERLIRS